MASFQRHFTFAEANDLLPWVKSVFAKVHRMLEHLTEESNIALPKSAPALGRGEANGNGHHRSGAQMLSNPGPSKVPFDLETVWPGLNDQKKMKLINGMLHALIDQGIVIQDVERGLIDFPAWRAGQEVLLCYELRDGDRIGFWHPLEGGYSGRQPIDELTE